MTKKIALLVILLSFGFELNAKWTRPIDEEANADKYGFEHDFCPKTNYGHTAIIVDTTEKFNEYQILFLICLFFNALSDFFIFFFHTIMGLQ